ncbi:peptidase, partial [Streptomyces spongiae]|nr:peptidase [Streptomyces spongiae]
MDESGGSGQPRSGSDETTERPAGRSTPAADTARPEPEPSENGQTPQAPADGATPARPEPSADHEPPAGTEPPADHRTATPTEPSPERPSSSTDHET